MCGWATSSSYDWRCRCWQTLAALGLFAAALAAPSCSRTSPAGQVIVYVAVDRGDAEPILNRFEQQTGIRVRAVYDAEAAKTTGLVTRLLAERRQPRCDVFWNNELLQTLLLRQQGALDSYEPSAAQQLAAPFRDAEGFWTAVAQRARVIVYNTRHVSEAEAPRSIFDLTDARWRGKAAIANPQFGTTRAHVAALFAALGPARAEQWLKALLANEVRIVDGNAAVKNLVAKARPGASPAYVGLTDTDDVQSGIAAGEPLAMVYPDQDELGTLMTFSTVALVRGSPHPVTARRLIDFLTSRQVQTELTAPGAGYLPVRDDVKKADLKTPTQCMTIDRSAWLEQLEPSSRWTNEHFHP